MKIVIHQDFGIFSLSREAYKELGLEWDGYGFAYNNYSKRNDPRLIEIVEKLGDRAGTKLRIVEISDEIEEVDYFVINDYDGFESISREIIVA